LIEWVHHQGEPMTEVLDITMWLLDRLADLARWLGRWP